MNIVDSNRTVPITFSKVDLREIRQKEVSSVSLTFFTYIYTHMDIDRLLYTHTCQHSTKMNFGSLSKTNVNFGFKDSY